MDNLAIIPARGGSKRIPDKNIKEFMGQPIISYAIKTAMGSGLFDRIIVSTDSLRIAEVAIAHGAEVPFMRPENLADDHTATAPVLLHALEELSNSKSLPDYFCCIYATAALLTPEDLIAGYDLLLRNNATTVFSVTRFSYPILRALKFENDHRVQMFWPEYEQSRSNDLTESFHDAGQFYWCNVEKFRMEKKLFSADSYAIVLPNHRVVDIDTPQDWQMAEILYQVLKIRNAAKKA